MNWIIIILVLLVLFYLYRKDYFPTLLNNKLKNMNIDSAIVISGKIDPTINGDVSRYTSFLDKPPSSSYYEKHNNDLHLYPFDEYTLYGFDDVKFADPE